MVEADSVLGARFGGALGAANATSHFVDLSARYDAGAGWSVGGSVRQGWTAARARGGIGGGGTILTNAFAADVAKDGLFTRDDSFGLRIAQPLRVASGGIDLSLPSYWDYASASVSEWSVQRINLAPAGRELDVETRYARPMLGGLVDTHLFWRRDPGHYDAVADDWGAALRFTLGF